MKGDSLVEIGVIGAAHGLRGEVKVHLHNPASKTLRPNMQAFLSRQDWEEQLEMRIRSVRASGPVRLVAFEGIEERTGARALTGARLFVKREDLPPLEEGEFYYQDLIGLPVHTREGRFVGKVTSVMKGATDILVVVEGPKEFMIPVVDEYIVSLGAEAIIVEEEGIVRAK